MMRLIRKIMRRMKNLCKTHKKLLQNKTNYINNNLFYAGLAQLVEQRIRNAWVGRSNLLTGTNEKAPLMGSLLQFIKMQINI